jgi:DNA repair protein RadA/Sms
MRDAPASLTEIPAVPGLRPPGVCITSLTEGTRAFNVEIQALVTPAAYGSPRIHCVGVDNSRVQMIAAIVERHVGDSIAGADMYVNVSGGFRIQDPAADLALAAAITSSLRNRPMNGGIWATGELSLAGEVRPVMQLPARLAVAARAGYTHAVIPASADRAEPVRTELVPLRVRKVQEALDHLLRTE